MPATPARLAVGPCDSLLLIDELIFVVITAPESHEDSAGPALQALLSGRPGRPQPSARRLQPVSSFRRQKYQNASNVVPLLRPPKRA